MINKIIMHQSKELEISNIIKYWYPVGFPINKNNKELKEDINNILNRMKIKGQISEICYNFGNSVVLSC